MQETESAGGVVLNAQGEVIVVNQNRDSWSLPKGHIDAGENTLQAAQREIAEEAGVTELTYVRPLGSYSRYRTGPGGKGEDMSELKHINMFLFTTTAKELAPSDPTNPEARWVSVENVADLLTNPKDKEFFLSIKDSLK